MRTKPVSRFLARGGLALMLGVSVAIVPAVTPAAVAAPPTITRTTLHFAVTIGPDRSQPCDIIGDLYRPSTATTARPAPAIMITNGFGGSKDTDTGMSTFLAGQGYVVLDYSGLGFGGSSCRITLDHPDYDGAAASQLISFLGGAEGIAYSDRAYTKPVAAVDFVQRDAKDHNGVSRANDPRVGMYGTSYGGGIQFAAAAADKRLDVIAPNATWNDLRYSLAPNNQISADGTRTTTPGTPKALWGLGFDIFGAVTAILGIPQDPLRVLGCPGWEGTLCTDLLGAVIKGYASAPALARLAQSSPSTYLSRITIPVLLTQGQQDTLFNLNEATRTYEALRAQGTPVAMMWVSGGHSGGLIEGDYSLTDPDPTTQYPIQRMVNWFAKYLKGQNISGGAGFAYLRDWVAATDGPKAAYVERDHYTPLAMQSLYLSAHRTLVRSSADIRTGSQGFLTGPLALPTSWSPPDLDLTGGIGSTIPSYDIPGTFASFTTPTLTTPLDVVGMPRVKLRVQAPTAGTLGVTSQLTLFVKLYDVAPDGSVSLIHLAVAPVRVADARSPFLVELPGIVHRFGVGHSLRLVVAGGDLNYRGSLVPNPVVITTGDPNQVLQLPVSTTG